MSQIALDTPSRPKPCTRPARRSARTSSTSSPSSAPAAGGQLGHGPGVTERVGRLQVDEVGDGQQRGVELVGGQQDGERRLGVDHRLPGSDVVEATEDLVGMAAQAVGQRGIELRARTAARASSLRGGRRPAPGGRPRCTRPSPRCATPIGISVAGQLPWATPSRPTARRRRPARRTPVRGGGAPRPASGPAGRAGRSCPPCPGGGAGRCPSRCASAGAVDCRPRSGGPSRPPRGSSCGSYSYLPDFMSMSSPNHLACS